MATASFKQLEHDGWAQKAGAYDDWLGPVTQQAIGPMLASLCKIYEGKRFLDIQPGPGTSQPQPPSVERSPKAWILPSL